MTDETEGPVAPPGSLDITLAIGVVGGNTVAARAIIGRDTLDQFIGGQLELAKRAITDVVRNVVEAAIEKRIIVLRPGERL